MLMMRKCAESYTSPLNVFEVNLKTCLPLHIFAQYTETNEITNFHKVLHPVTTK
jgi:hypothetical protein